MRGLRHLIYLSLILIVTQARAQVVDIPDPNLERAIRETLALTDGPPHHPAGTTKLNAAARRIPRP